LCAPYTFALYAFALYTFAPSQEEAAAAGLPAHRRLQARKDGIADRLERSRRQHQAHRRPHLSIFSET